MTTPATVLVCGEPYPLTMRVPEYQAAFAPQLGRDSIYAAIDRGEIPHVRRGRSILILTIPAVRDLGYEVDREGPDKNEEPPGSDSSKTPNPAKDRTRDQYPTEPAGQPASGLRAVP